MALDNNAQLPESRGSNQAELTRLREPDCTFTDKLSAELRIQIYGHVLGKATHALLLSSVHKGDLEIEQLESAQQVSSESLISTSILAVNKQIHDEALDALWNTKTVRFTFSELTAALHSQKSGRPPIAGLARDMEVVECDLAERDTILHVLFNLDLFSRLRSIKVLTEHIALEVYVADHCTVRGWTKYMGLPAVGCLDVGKFAFNGDSALENVQFVNSKIVRMWPNVKSTPDDHDTLVELRRIVDEWAVVDMPQDFVAWTSHTSLRLSVGMHEAMLSELRRQGASLSTAPDRGNGDWRGPLELAKWTSSAIASHATLPFDANVPDRLVPMHKLGPQHHPARPETATEHLALNVASYRCVYDLFQWRIMLYQMPSWPELGEVDVGVQRAEVYQRLSQYL